jgi:hypothetical protein
VTPKFPDHYEILNLAASSKSRPYAPAEHRTPGRLVFFGGRLGDWSTDQMELRRALRKATSAFAASETYEQAFRKLATQDNRKRYTQFWLQPSRDTVRIFLTDGTYERNHAAASVEWLSQGVDACFRGIMRCLATGTQENADFDRVWWESLWAFVEPRIALMLDAQKRIRAGTPISWEQIKAMQRYVSLGRVELDFTSFDGDDLHRLRMHMTWIVDKPQFRSPLVTMGEILLTQPVFALAQELHGSYDKAKYIRQCHAPSCGKPFYTHRKTQVVCPGSQGNRKNACGLEWIRYKRYLQKRRKDPPKDWKTPELQQQFLEQDKA